jgi:poly-beta-hydroxyalkanoate depolymerase
MVDLTEQERAALRAAMRAMAEVMAEIGWTTPLNALSEQQVLTLAEVAVDAFQDAMRASVKPDVPEVPF